MCDANAMAGVGAVQSIAGAFGAYGASSAQAQLYRALGRAQKQAYDAAAEISDQNALLSLRAGDIETEKGATNLSVLRNRGRQVISSQRAAAGAAGLATTSGTPALILQDTAAQLAVDVEALRLNNRRSKWGYDVQAMNYRNQARQQRHAGAAAEAGMNYQAAVSQQTAQTSLLSGISSALFKYGDATGLWAPKKKEKG